MHVTNRSLRFFLIAIALLLPTQASIMLAQQSSNDNGVHLARIKQSISPSQTGTTTLALIWNHPFGSSDYQAVCSLGVRQVGLIPMS